MEEIKIKQFLALNNGSGYGYGSGSGDGDGSGYGYGSGSGDGSGYGDGDGDVKSFNNHKVYMIDDVPTIFHSIHKNVARGETLNRDFTTEKCYIVKGNNYFAHGETIEEAVKALQDKIFEDLDTDERIEMFINEFELDKKYPAMKFFDWHNKLTGSCEMGRKNFAYNHNIDLDNDMFTVEEFIELTKNDYGCEIIKELADKIKGE